MVSRLRYQQAIALDCGGHRTRCWKKDWVIDLDVQKFSGSVPWDLMVKAVQANITASQQWNCCYVHQWRAARL